MYIKYLILKINLIYFLRIKTMHVQKFKTQIPQQNLVPTSLPLNPKSILIFNHSAFLSVINFYVYPQYFYNAIFWLFKNF